MAIDGIEFDHDTGAAVFSAGIHDGGIEVDIGEDWAGRNQPNRPQGFQQYLDFRFSLVEATLLRDWLTRALVELTGDRRD